MLRLRRRTRGVPAAEPRTLATLTGVVLLCALPSGAAEPEAPLVFPFSGDHRIHSLEGEEICQTIVVSSVEVDRCLRLTVLIDAAGRYQGTAGITYSTDSEEVLGSLAGDLRGRQKRKKNGITYIKLKSKLLGSIQVPVAGEVGIKAKMRCDATISAAGVLDGACDLDVKRPKDSGLSETIPMPGQVIGGDWTLTITELIADLKGKLEGSAVDSFGYSYAVSGKYDASKDRSKLKVRGQKGTLSHGAKVKIKDLDTPAPSEGSGQARYKLLRAKGRTQTTAVPPEE